MTPDDETLIILDGLARRSRLGMILLALAILFGIAGLLLLPGCALPNYHDYDRTTTTKYPDGREVTVNEKGHHGACWQLFVDSEVGLTIDRKADGTAHIEYGRKTSPNAAFMEAVKDLAGTAKNLSDVAKKGALIP